MTEFQRRLEANIRESLRFAVGEVQEDAVAHMVAGVNAVLDHPSAPAPEHHVEPVEIPGELEMFNGKLTKVVDASRTGWWRFHTHRDRDGYCDNPARGY